jgi:hypothetical protein
LPNRPNAIATPDANIAMKKVHELSASCSPPEMPWPEVQPPAMRAPNSITAPPKKAAA